MGALVRTYTFSSGWTVQYKRVSPQIVIAVQASIPWPEPVKQLVDYGNGPVEEANEAAPEYLAALAERGRQVNRTLASIYIERGMLPLDEEQQAAVDELRQDFAARGLTALPDDDKRCFLEYIACGREGEVGEFLGALTGASQPQEAQIAAAVATF